MIQAVIFDLDDTLYLERDCVRSGYRAVAASIGANAGAIEEWLWDRFLSGRATDAFDDLNLHFKLKLKPEQIRRLVEVYRNHKPDIAPIGGIPQMLGLLLHSDYRLGLLSDGFMPAQRIKFEATQLERFFDAVVFTEELGRECWKPSPRGFELIAQKLAVPHESCVYVADNVAKDFIAPNRLGWRTIRYRCPGQLHALEEAEGDAAAQFDAKSPEELRDAVRKCSRI